MKHATVILGEYTVPLIGIPVSATEEECDCCHDIFHITKLVWNGKQMLCEKCDDKPVLHDR